MLAPSHYNVLQATRSWLMTSIDLRVHSRSTNQQGLKVMAKPIKMLDLVTLLLNCLYNIKVWRLFRCTLVTCVCILGIIDTSRINSCVNCSCIHSCVNFALNWVIRAFYTNSFRSCFMSKALFEQMYAHYYWECQSLANVLLHLFIGATVRSAFFT